MTKPGVLAVTGPTASGKSALALEIALKHGGEIVCMDALQVYRGMDVGTAKPTKGEQALVPHHLLDVRGPEEPFSAAEYARLAEEAIGGILSRGRPPVLCGGTGLYLRALRGGLDFGGTPSDPAVRAKYQAVAEREGREALHALLKERDPETARELHPNDLRRVVRALEVLELTGRPFQPRQAPRADGGKRPMAVVALDWPRDALYRRIDERVKRMLDDGLAEEVRGLLDCGVSPQAQAMQGIGYKELVPYVQGQTSLEDAEELMARRTRNYAKRQLTWLRAEPGVRWLPGDAGMVRLISEIKHIMEGT